MDIPIIATRHVQKNFGDIENVITEVTHPGRKVFDKTSFSMLEPKVFEHLKLLKNSEDNSDRD